MSKDLLIIVEELPNVRRIDRYLVLKLINYQELSRTQIQKLIVNQRILVNGNIIDNNYQIAVGDQIQIFWPPKPQLSLDQDRNQKLTIIYEDDFLLVINKPKQLVVHPAVGNLTNTLVNILLAKNVKLSDDVVRPGIVHRLDKNTTGLLIVAKENFVHQHLTKQLQNKSLARKYFALVRGIINNDDGLIDGPIGRDIKNRKRMAIVFKNSKPAQTKFRVLKRFLESNITFIECELLTGRTHQIRVHLKAIKHSILGDHLYGNKEDLNDSNEQYLHAHELRFIHPATNETMQFNCELPTEFQIKLESLK